MTDSKVEIPIDDNEDMEEGELSDDSTGPPLDPVINIGQNIPDLLKEIGGTADILTMNEEAMEKMSVRAKRFKTGSVISVSELGSLYKSLGVPKADCPERRQWMLEEVLVWGEGRLNHSDLTSLFFEYHPLSVEVMRNGREAAVTWATPTQAAKAIHSLSREIGEPGNSKLVKHVISLMEDTKVIAEETPNLDMVHPEDIDIDLPEGGPWRLIKGELEGVILVRFARASSNNVRPAVGLLSRSKREEFLLEQVRAVEREQELRSKVVDKRNHWGSVAARWADEQRGGGGSRNNVRDWDTPVDQIVETNKGSIKDRLNFNARVNIDINNFIEQHEEEDEKEDEDNDEIDWSSRMKKPRMGMVADMVEKKSSAVSRLGGRKEEVMKRKVTKRDGIDRENEKKFDGRRLGDRLGERKEDIKRIVPNRDEHGADERVNERTFAVGGRRLGDRFAGRRLEGRLGGGNFTIERKAGGRLIDLGRKDSKVVIKKRDYDSGDSLERDDGADIMDDRATDMVIRVTQSSDSEDNRDRIRHSSGREERRRMEKEEKERRQNKEGKERRQDREREKQRDFVLEKEIQEEKKTRMERIKAIKEREDGLFERKGMKEKNQLTKKEERKDKYKREDQRKDEGRKRYSSEEESKSESEGSESGSESDSSSESHSEESSDSESESEKSESEDERKKKKKHSYIMKKEDNKSRGTVDGKAKLNLLKSKDIKSKSYSISNKESSEDKKKAAELKEKLKNYLKKAKEAKENKKKSLKPN